MELNLTFLNIGLAFIEGLLLIASPCILPVLPLVLAGSIDGGKRRPLGVIIGFVVTFAIFTLFARQLFISFGFSISFIRTLSYILLFIFGCLMISSYMAEKFSGITDSISDFGLRLLNDSNGYGFKSGVFYGALVGLVWTPCAGPILAAVIVQTVLQSSTLASFFTVLAFGVGAALPMLLIVILGRALKDQLALLNKNSELLRKVLGYIIILTVLALCFGNSSYFGSLQNNESVTTSGMEFKDGLLHPFVAPPIEGIAAWINSPPLDLQHLRGKVVLIDFWAYSCINCVRTLPYLKNWYQKYNKDGFVIIGVHSPEFDFEADVKNVEEAVKKAGILYPVALDNSFTTWKNYHNSYWPAHYLIDKNGSVVYEHFGEGNYATTENNIRFLLGHDKPIAASDSVEPLMVLTPETYLGYARSTGFASKQNIHNKLSTYTYPKQLASNEWALSGKWTIARQEIVSGASGASIKLRFLGHKVFAVMDVVDKPVNIKLKLNGTDLVADKGADVQNSEVAVNNARLYNLVNLQNGDGGELEITSNAPGLEIYTFTFGS